MMEQTTTNRSLALTMLLVSTGLLCAQTRSADEVTADQATGFNEIGTISLRGVTGSMQDIERLIALRAEECGATFYRITHMQEYSQKDQWQACAIIYS